MVINERELLINVGSTARLYLSSIKNTDVSDVKWYFMVKNPTDVLYTADEYNKINGICTIDESGNIIAKAKGSITIWAKLNDALYRCDIIIKDDKISRLEKAVEDIASRFRHLMWIR